MSPESRRLAGILLVVLPTVIYGGTLLLSQLIDSDSGYMENPLRQDLFRAGHAHAGVLLVLSLIALRYVDEANLSASLKWFARVSIPLAAIFLPAGFFFSILSPTASEPNSLIYLAYIGAVDLAAGLVVLGVGLIRAKG
ncbi:MAG: hypothetical protein HY708_05605 [Ignavibacteriae bacterium]|nr:hypothetical protein [Ignavibacteriota bacterium]